MDLREKVAIALAKRRYWNYAGSYPIPEDALYDADTILALFDEERRALEKDRDDADRAAKGWRLATNLADERAEASEARCAKLVEALRDVMHCPYCHNCGDHFARIRDAAIAAAGEKE